MDAFILEWLPGRVVFGPGTLDRLAQEIEQLGANRALVLSTPQQEALAQDLARRLGERCAGIFPRAVMHVPVEIAHAARRKRIVLMQTVWSQRVAARPSGSARRSPCIRA